MVTVTNVIDMLNFFPSKNVILDTMGPAMLVEGKKIDFGKKRIEFGEYAMVYMGTKGNMEKGAYQKSL